jgi:23S rRNA pseudouridine1911/1915/1917 synthase
MQRLGIRFWLIEQQFQERTLTKKYLTFVYGEIKDRFGIINRPIGRSPNDFRRWSATRGARGELRDAETWYTLLAYRAGFSFLEVEPKTGRTHQIRVHFKAINHPVVCDGLYAPEKILEKPDALGFKRNALHAYSIEFTNCAGKKVMVKAPVPDDFSNAFIELGIQDVAKKEGLC